MPQRESDSSRKRHHYSDTLLAAEDLRRFDLVDEQLQPVEFPRDR
jgi:hypothetical protein